MITWKLFSFGPFGLHTSLSWLFMPLTSIYWALDMSRVWKFSEKIQKCCLPSWNLVRLCNFHIHLTFWCRMPGIPKKPNCKTRIWGTPGTSVCLFEDDEDGNRELFCILFFFFSLLLWYWKGLRQWWNIVLRFSLFYQNHLQNVWSKTRILYPL